MEIKVIRPGLYSVIQDAGRWGMTAYGVSPSGVMDRYSALFANSLLKNTADEAVLEITIQGPTLKFLEETRVAVGGPDGEIYLNKKPKAVNEVIAVQKNDLLEIKSVTRGCRLYLAVEGGFLTEKILGSRSMQQGITKKRKIEKGDLLYAASFAGGKIKRLNATLKFDKRQYKIDQIKVFPGPEFEWLSSKEKDVLFKEGFHLSPQCNRMAFLLKELLKNHLDSINTGPVLPGTVQLTQGGKLIILMKDCQVTGGYPRILQVTEESMITLAQKKAREVIYLQLVS